MNARSSGPRHGYNANGRQQAQQREAANSYSRNSANYGSGQGGYRPIVPNGYQPGASNSNPYVRSAAQYSTKKRGMSRGKKIAVGVVCVLLICLVGVGVAGAWYVSQIDQSLGTGNKETDAAIAAVTDQTTNFDEPFYMLLIGSDARADDASMGARSDTNILCYIDPTQKIVSMVSIPRDTMIEIDGSVEKFNAAYSYNGAASSIVEANQLCNVKISHYAEVNFEELVNLVNAVGGVEVDVPERIDDPDAGSIVIEEGVQTLDGEAALVFARSRAYTDGDFTRTSNQRLLIEALINKVVSLSVTELPGVIQQAAQCVTTDLSVTEIVDLATRFKDTSQLSIYSAMVPSTTATVGGISYVLTYEPALEALMQLIESGQDPSTLEITSDMMVVRQEQQDLMGSSSVIFEDEDAYDPGGGPGISNDSTYYSEPSYDNTGGYSNSYSSGGGSYTDSYSSNGGGYTDSYGSGGGYADTSGGTGGYTDSSSSGGYVESAGGATGGYDASGSDGSAGYAESTGGSELAPAA